MEPAAFESLERDDHNTRKLKDFHTLYCLNVGLTFVAVPHVVLIERLLLLEGPKTVVNVNRVRVLTFIPSFLCTERYCRPKEPVESLMDFLVPNQLNLDFAASDLPVLHKHTVVARNSKFIQ